ncbi:hypothetical protein QYE76_028025 [Lolium multiflorum]|uniref:Uncharacterized protein n=1 Tax=Lolium multiflorum TaxID=4521 RepID=A0AAD8VE60_LOLMU|nr:hypothetical protein QYE76_028025 [Lolium multiflorum]
MRASRVRPTRPPEIYRVPEVLLAADRGAYQPRFLSLGPYHRGGSATEEMRRKDGEKAGNMAYAVQGGGPPVVEYMKAIASIQADARSRYEGGVIDMEWDAFCRMLLLDAFQLITLLEYLGFDDVDEPSETGGCAEQEDCKPRTGVLSSIGHDLMMLENQIPFFVAQKMYGLRHGDGGDRIAELAWRTIKSIMCGVPSAAASYPPAEKCQHLVHLCHAYLKPSNLGRCSRGERGGEYGRFRRATEYHEAGVRFRRLCSEDGSAQRPLLDVTFSNGVLRMARHRIDETTNYILRNVLVYEQRYLEVATSGDAGYVAAYVVFMSQLLGGPEDVALLSRRGVIEHHLGNDAEVCALFRGLAQGLVFDPSGDHYLRTVGVKLQAYYESRVNRWGAWVIRHRLGNPWLAAAWVFGAMAVLGTILQTVVALLQYLDSQRPTGNVGT